MDAQPFLHIENLHHSPRFPAAVVDDPVKDDRDIAGGAPEVADLLGPQPGLMVAPFAEAEDDWPARLTESLPHGRIGLPGVEIAGGAPVVFEIVHTPAAVLERILVFVAAAAGPPGAGRPARIRIDAEFEPPGMDIVGKGLHA